MAKTKRDKKGIRELLKMLERDNINAEPSDEEVNGKGALGDIVIQYKGRKYPITVKRDERIPNKTLEKLNDETELLMFRKNRKNWKVYMDLSTLILLLLNNRS